VSSQNKPHRGVGKQRAAGSPSSDGAFDEGQENLGVGLAQSLPDLVRVRKRVTVTRFTAGKGVGGGVSVRGGVALPLYELAEGPVRMTPICQRVGLAQVNFPPGVQDCLVHVHRDDLP
jgi:hypothetical protein